MRDYLRVAPEGREADTVRRQLADLERLVQAKADVKP
jgi:hypothetical protein